MTRIDNVVPGLADGKADELFEKVKSIRELAESFNKKSGVLMEEGRPLAARYQPGGQQHDPQDQPAGAERQPAPAEKAEPEAAVKPIRLRQEFRRERGGSSSGTTAGNQGARIPRRPS